jgi:anti-anti-sigma regulatory factor
MTSSAPQGKLRTNASVSSTSDGDLLILAGDIEDDTTLATYADQLGRDPIIDLGGVNFINSVGVREWVMLLDRLGERGLSVRLRNVSEPMVRQMGMVIEAKGAATVESFFAPYTCPKCGDERALLIDVKQHEAALAANTPPALPCGACGTPAEFDEFPARYLAFLS